MQRVIAALVIILGALPTIAGAKSWDFERWQVRIAVQPDSSIVVRETQTFNFRGSFSWVTRDLPKAKGIVYRDITVFDEAGQPLSGDEVTIDNRGNEASIRLNFKLADTTATWTFAYTAWNALGFFPDHDELYWNAVSNDRDTPIKKVDVEVTLPEPLTSTSDWRLRLLVGPTGSTQESGSFEVVDRQTTRFTGSDIQSRENFTIVAGWPKGLVTEQRQPVRERRGLFELLGLALLFAHPIAVFIFLFRRWQQRGRDPQGRGTIIPQYEPPDQAPPAVVGVLIDERADQRDLAATIIDLAVRGYLKITETREGLFHSKKYTFTKLKEAAADAALGSYERQTFDGLFESGDVVRLDDLKNRFYKNIKAIHAAMYQAAVQRGYFPESPEKVRTTYLIIGGVIVFLAFFLANTIFKSLSGWAYPPLILDGLLVMGFGWALPRRTLRGVQAKEWALGFRLYLHTAERYRVKAMTPETFERFLPYAMVFGVERDWAKAFEGIVQQNPTWYSTTDGRMFSALVFTSSLSEAMNATVAKVLSSSPSSHSGFGGGGFGGGGGGGGGSGAG